MQALNGIYAYLADNFINLSLWKERGIERKVSEFKFILRVFCRYKCGNFIYEFFGGFNSIFSFFS